MHFFQVFYGRAVARMALGTPGLAVPDVEAVLKLRPLHLPSLVARAEIREANGQYRQARGDCLKGLRVCRSLPATVAGVLEGEAALEATLEQVRWWWWCYAPVILGLKALNRRHGTFTRLDSCPQSRNTSND